jgi:hypothetical protein
MNPQKETDVKWRLERKPTPNKLKQPNPNLLKKAKTEDKNQNHGKQKIQTKKTKDNKEQKTNKQTTEDENITHKEHKQTDRKTSGERQRGRETYPPTRWWTAEHQENPKTPPRDSGAGTDQDKVVRRADRNLIAPPPLDDLHCEGKGLDLRGRKERKSEEIRERSEKRMF